MLTKAGPKILEFNARFGDPETQVYLTRLENDLVELLDASVSGTLDKIELKWSPSASVCVVMASGGYPGKLRKGQAHQRPGRRGEIAGRQSFPRRNGLEGKPNRHERRTRSRRDGARQRFEIRPSRRLRRRGKNPFRRRAIPPRHRCEGFLIFAFSFLF